MATIFDWCCRRIRRNRSCSPDGSEEGKGGADHATGAKGKNARSSRSDTTSKKKKKGGKKGAGNQGEEIADLSVVKREHEVLRPYQKPPPPRNRARASRAPRGPKVNNIEDATAREENETKLPKDVPATSAAAAAAGGNALPELPSITEEESNPPGPSLDETDNTHTERKSHAAANVVSSQDDLKEAAQHDKEDSAAPTSPTHRDEKKKEEKEKEGEQEKDKKTEEQEKGKVKEEREQEKEKEKEAEEKEREKEEKEESDKEEEEEEKDEEKGQEDDEKKGHKKKEEGEVKEEKEGVDTVAQVLADHPGTEEARLSVTPLRADERVSDKEESSDVGESLQPQTEAEKREPENKLSIDDASSNKSDSGDGGDSEDGDGAASVDGEGTDTGQDPEQSGAGATPSEPKAAHVSSPAAEEGGIESVPHNSDSVSNLKSPLTEKTSGEEKDLLKPGQDERIDQPTDSLQPDSKEDGDDTASDKGKVNPAEGEDGPELQSVVKKLESADDTTGPSSSEDQRK